MHSEGRWNSLVITVSSADCTPSRVEDNRPACAEAWWLFPSVRPVNTVVPG